MKKNITLFLSIVFGIGTLSAQEIELGAGVGYGTDIETLSYNFRAFYTLNFGLQVGADAQFTLEKNRVDKFVEYKQNRDDYSICAKYIIPKLAIIEPFRIYPIIGVSYITISEVGASRHASHDEMKIDQGFNYFGVFGGAGVMYNVKDIFEVYAETKYHYCKKEPQMVLNIGIAYKINFSSK